MQFSYQLAFRYIINAYSKKNLGAMINICVLSIIISTFSFALILSIMNGFDKGTRDKLQGINSDLTIYSSTGDSLDYEKISQVLSSEFGQYIEASSPQAYGQIIVQSKSQSTNLNLVMLKGIDFDKERIMHKNLSYIFNNNSGDIILGEPLAKQLFVKAGDKIDIFFPESEIYGSKVNLQSTEATIKNLYKLGISEFDEHVAFCSLDYFNSLFDTGITSISINLKPAYKNQYSSIVNDLKTRLKLEVTSWQEMYPALVSALALEKYAMALILFLVLLIASMNIISLLYMFIVQKRKDIAILKSLGMKDSQLITVFILIGVIISLFASCIGLILAYVASWLINYFDFIPLPDIYYISSLKAEFDIIYIPIILLAVVVLSFIASYIPARKISNISVSDILKNI